MPIFWNRKPAALSAEQRRALKLLAESKDGIPESLFLAHGFTAAITATLISARLVIADVRHVRAGGRTIAVRILRITDAGRQTL